MRDDAADAQAVGAEVLAEAPEGVEEGGVDGPLRVDGEGGGEGLGGRGGGVGEDGEGVDLVDDQVDLVFLAQPHEGEERFARVAAAEGVVRVAEEDGGDFAACGGAGLRGQKGGFVARDAGFAAGVDVAEGDGGDFDAGPVVQVGLVAAVIRPAQEELVAWISELEG